MRILICGDRNWTDKAAIKREIYNTLLFTPKGYCLEEIIIHGGAKGADKLADEAAKELSTRFKCLKIIPFPADWDKYGKSAGMIRNTKMLKEGKPDIVLAFYNNIEASKGTKNMIFQANAAGVPVRLFAR